MNLLKKLTINAIRLLTFVVCLCISTLLFEDLKIISQFGFALINSNEFSYEGCMSLSDKRDRDLCDWTDKTISYYDKECDSCLIKKDYKRQIIISFDYLSPNILGFAGMQDGQCHVHMQKYYPWEYDPLEFRLTLFHEIGHCIGFMHEQSKESIMYYASSPLHKEKTVLDFVKGKFKDRLKNGFVFYNILQ